MGSPTRKGDRSLGFDMKTLYFLYSLLFVSVSIANAQTHDKLPGAWTLQIENLRHEVITTMIIHFTDNPAISCLGGNWKQVVVDSHKTSNMKFFPVNEPLSYEIKDNSLTIGRNQICDAYLQLRGIFDNLNIVGNYIAFGWESEQLGYFILKSESK
jgi:hypothetical protein